MATSSADDLPSVEEMLDYAAEDAALASSE